MACLLGVFRKFFFFANEKKCVTKGVADTFLHLRKSYVRRRFMPGRCDDDRFAKCAIT